jgi:hypothetical protein
MLCNAIHMEALLLQRNGLHDHLAEHAHISALAGLFLLLLILTQCNGFELD